ncbi:MAG: S8 family serine peptidase [Bacteroidetes bacterium]|nr:S8 family serine peptidase [Bacteroidota bacterium]
MKHHYIIKLRTEANRRVPENVPNWRHFINDKSVTLTNFIPVIDGIFNQNHIAFWLTAEYTKSGPNWSEAEIDNGLNRTYRLILQGENKLPESGLLQIQHLPEVEQARELQVVETEIPQYQVPLSVSASEPTKTIAETIRLAYAHQHTKGIPDIKIAVLDTGASLAHPEIKDKIKHRADWVDLNGLDTGSFIGDVTEYDEIPEDEVGHGSHVSGIIGAKGIQMEGGIAPNCSLMIVRVLATMKDGGRNVGAGIVDNINNGIKWAVDHGADVINMSLGIKHTGGGLPHEDVIKYAIQKNVAIVAASGNDGTNEKYYPGALKHVIAVGATDFAGEVTPFTSFGAPITVVAPGLRLYSSYVNQTYAYASGTSQASPIVAGSVALMKSYARENGKSINTEFIHQCLAFTSDKPDTKFRTTRAGFGLLNLTDAFKFLKNHI